MPQKWHEKYERKSMKRYLERQERLWDSQIRGDYRGRTIKSTWNPELDFATEKKKH